MAKTNSGLVAYAKAQVGLPYWYGTYGQTATASLYSSKKKQYPSNYTASDFKSQYGKRVHDCVGLIKGYLWSTSTTSTPKYTSSQDKSAQGMYTAAKTKGKISTFPKTAGLLVFKSNSSAISGIHHVGVYGGDGYVYEAKGHAYGVVKTTYKASDWQYWAQCPYTTDDTTGTGSTTSSSSGSSGSSSSTSSSKTSSTSSTASSSSSGKSKTATEPAKSLSKSLVGTYQVTATSGLYMRNGAGKNYSKMVILPYGTKVKNYGYYTTVSGVKWLYIQVTYNGITYTGHSSGEYLKKVSS